MFKNFFRVLGLKKIARQLRKPNGRFGLEVGSRMNKSNASLYDLTLEVMQPGYYESILEIGFGNGKFFPQVLAKAEGLSLTGIDYSETMVEAARRFNENLVREGRLTLVQGNSDRLPFADQSFDKVFCINVVYFWDDPTHHLSEIHRVLKPGGKFYATVRNKETLDALPFTKYGFTSYTEAQWEVLLNKQKFSFITAAKLNEAPIDFNEKQVHPQSLCLVAQK